MRVNDEVGQILEVIAVLLARAQETVAQERELAARAQRRDEFCQLDVQPAQVLDPEVGHELVALRLIHAGGRAQIVKPCFFRASAERPTLAHTCEPLRQLSGLEVKTLAPSVHLKGGSPTW